MTATVYLVRHGRTALNAQDRLRGLADPPLDDTGIAQAEAVAAALPAREVTAVYSSPLQRARRTAEIVARRYGLAAHADPRFTDRDYGTWTGHDRQAVVSQFGSVDAAPGVEATSAVLARVRPALDAVREDGRSVVIVSHDAVIRPLVAAFAHGDEPAIPTGSWSALTWDDGAWAVTASGVVP